MDPGSIAAIIVSLVAATGGILSQRAASKAAKVNAETGGRLKMEDEAYERARNMDVATITRQDAEIAELRIQNNELRKQNEQLLVVEQQNVALNEDVKRVAKDNDSLHAENTRLHAKITELETKVTRLEDKA
jgi:TolA-binding protein